MQQIEDFIIAECRNFSVQVYNWLYNEYYDYIYDFLTIENSNIIDIKIRMNITKQLYAKKGTQIVAYIIKTFRYPYAIKVNWRYNRSMFNIYISCGLVRQNEDSVE